MAEPRFYNPCGNCGNRRIWWGLAMRHRAGTYLQTPLSEIMLASGYAQLAPLPTGLSEREVWRLQGAAHLGTGREQLACLSVDLQAFRWYEANERFLDDQSLEALWRPPPP
jgi:hypothetical protein